MHANLQHTNTGCLTVTHWHRRTGLTDYSANLHSAYCTQLLHVSLSGPDLFYFSLTKRAFAHWSQTIVRPLPPSLHPPEWGHSSGSPKRQHWLFSFCTWLVEHVAVTWPAQLLYIPSVCFQINMSQCGWCLCLRAAKLPFRWTGEGVTLIKRRVGCSVVALSSSPAAHLNNGVMQNSQQ